MYGGYGNNNYGFNYQPYGGFADNMAMYRQPQQQLQQAPQPQTQQQVNDIIWVQGEAGAKSYPVARGGTVVLWDSENPVIYIKSADMSGIPSTRIFEISERTGNQPAQKPAEPASDYVTRVEFEELKRQFAEFNRAESVSVPATDNKQKGGNKNG